MSSDYNKLKFDGFSNLHILFLPLKCAFILYSSHNIGQNIRSQASSNPMKKLQYVTDGETELQYKFSGTLILYDPNVTCSKDITSFSFFQL